MKEQQRKTIIKHRIEKAGNTLQEANHLLALGYVNNAVNRIYYACFYAITALLLQKYIIPFSIE